MDGACCSTSFTDGGSGVVSLGVLVLAGATVSVGHCMGMCGPILAAVGTSDSTGDGRRWPALSLYHTGRVLAYVTIGVAFGLLGSLSRIDDSTTTFQAVLSGVAGALAVLVGLGLAGLLPRRLRLEPTGVGAHVVRTMRPLLTSRRRSRFFGLGVANGFLPCGPVLAAAAVAAAAASPLDGALAMAAYGLGTVPALLALGIAIGRIDATTRARFVRVGAMLVVVVGGQLMLRGAAAMGYVQHAAIGPVVLW